MFLTLSFQKKLLTVKTLCDEKLACKAVLRLTWVSGASPKSHRLQVKIEKRLAHVT